VEQDALQWSALVADVDEDEAVEMTVTELLECSSENVDDVDAWRRFRVAASKHGWDLEVYDTTPVGQLSPGCAVRAYLAVALGRSDVRLLLLDEPTNHADLATVLWLEAALAATKKAAIIVSHDRRFLDAACDHVWDLSNKTLAVSGATYSHYCHAKEMAIQQQRVAYDQQRDRHKRLTAAADRLRQASERGSKHKSSDHDLLQRDFKRDRAGRSGRAAKALEALRDHEEKVDRVVDRPKLRIPLDESPSAGGDSSILLGAVCLGRGPSLPPVTLRLNFGERVAIVGHNGSGKSTLLQTILGTLAPAGGDVHVGRELRVGSLAQEHDALPRVESPRHYLATLANLTPFDAGTWLYNFGLTRQQLDRPVGVLNPGARARVLLAGFAARKVNTLVLDEPTNHLDDEALAEVLASLNDLKGTLLVVSHGRDFLADLRLDRVLRLDRRGLVEIDDLDTYFTETADTAAAVVAGWGAA